MMTDELSTEAPKRDSGNVARSGSPALSPHCHLVKYGTQLKSDFQI